MPKIKEEWESKMEYLVEFGGYANTEKIIRLVKSLLPKQREEIKEKAVELFNDKKFATKNPRNNKVVWVIELDTLTYWLNQK